MYNKLIAHCCPEFVLPLWNEQAQRAIYFYSGIIKKKF